MAWNEAVVVMATEFAAAYATLRAAAAAADAMLASARAEAAAAEAAAAAADTNPRIYRGHLYGGAAAQNAA